ncbi:MAG: polymerase beta, Nucleotidyltransferase [Candidatus Levybacteria bacterium]|nr:polymerase beta, Nucleotidyltransferase [Candidatus Levybacteria bacterium]
MKDKAENINPLDRVPADMRMELDKFVEGVISYEPIVEIDEIILFGSLAKGNWNRQKSDIDLIVVVAEDLNYEYLNYLYVHQVMGNSTTEQTQLITYGAQRTSLEFQSKLHFIVCTPSDFNNILNRFNDGRRSLGETIREGITLYKRQKPA